MTMALLPPRDREYRLTQEASLLFWLPTVIVQDASRHVTRGVKL